MENIDDDDDDGDYDFNLSVKGGVVITFFPFY